MAKTVKVKVRKGWHLDRKECPHKGKSIKVDPIRDKKQIKQIMENLGGNPRNYALFVVGIHSGLRARDLLHLRFSDTFRPDSEGGYKVKKEMQVTEHKTKKVRHIPLGRKANKALKNLLPDNVTDVDMDSYIFSSRKGKKHGKALTVQRLHKLVNDWCEAVGVDGNFGTHTLRKTFAYHLLRQGARIDLLMDILGHSSMAVTLRYAGITKEETSKAILQLKL